MSVILASASAARQDLLRAAGLDFIALPAHMDEAAVKDAARADGSSAADTALLLAAMKARRVAMAHPDALVVGADQMLVCGESWFDKPPDLNDARTQLQSLRGRMHHLPTAVVCFRGAVQIWHHVAVPALTMRNFSDAFLDRYLTAEGAAVLNSVGAYRIEGLGIQLFTRIEGGMDTIRGLPLLPLLDYLRGAGEIAV